MNLFYFTVGSGDGISHFTDTILNKFPIGQYHDLLDETALTTLKKEKFADAVQMWGAIPGSQNTKRWEAMNSGDRVLVYQDKKFVYYGTVFGKTRNPQLAQKAWGLESSGKTWELVYFIKDLVPVEIRFSDFSRLMDYSISYNFARGFSRVDSERLNRLMEVFSSIDEAIDYLSNSSSTMDKFEVELNISGERALETSICDEMTEEQYVNYIYGLNSEASIETIEGLRRIRKYNKRIVDDLKALYDHCCQICGGSALNDYGVSIVEGHHIDGFSLTQNNSPENIIVLCPDHHRSIHKAKGEFDPVTLTIKYLNGFTETLKHNKHFKVKSSGRKKH